MYKIDSLVSIQSCTLFFRLMLHNLETFFILRFSKSTEQILRRPKES